ncbi:GNAT family N-acetyltransferase [Halobacillus sp. MO56]
MKKEGLNFIILLSNKNYDLALRLLEKDKLDHTFSYSVLEGIIDGKVYVDNKFEPKSALIEIENGIHHLYGSSENIPFYQWVVDKINEKVTNNQLVVLFSNETFEIHLKDTNLTYQKNLRTTFSFNDSNFKNTLIPKIPDNLILERINEKNIKESDLFPPRFYEMYWNDTDTFLTHGFGFRLIDHENKVICEATSPASSSNKIDLDIMTDESFRGYGLGKFLAYHFISYGQKNNKFTDWACDKQNVPSYKLAKALGFEEKSEHPIYIFQR